MTRDIVYKVRSAQRMENPYFPPEIFAPGADLIQ